MDELNAFEHRFTDRLRRFAQSGIGPVDAAAVARAVATAHPRTAAGTRTVRWIGFPVDRRAWAIALAIGLLVTLLGGALLIGSGLLPVRPLNVSRVAPNGWIAFTVSQPGPSGADDDLDIWLVALDRDARLVVGTDSDRVDQLCPAFSPDGRSLAYGRVEGSTRQAALVVADVSDDGRVSDRLTIDVGDGWPAPCPVWSPDGEQVAFGANRTSPVNPTTAAAGSEVRVVTVAGPRITVLPNLLATDLEWSPDGTLLAIASGSDERVNGEILQDGRIHLYAPASGSMRSLDTTLGAAQLTWSPDGRYIVYTGVASAPSPRLVGLGLRAIDVETGRQRVVAPPFFALHGIGPVWSPDGDRIVYQRGFRLEHSEVVLLTPGDVSDEPARPREAVVPETARGSGERFDPYRVTFSPDGQYLLMMAWGVPPDTTRGTVEDPFLVAIPVDPAMPKVVLSRMDGLVPYDGYDDTTFVPIQVWGRVPSD